MLFIGLGIAVCSVLLVIWLLTPGAELESCVLNAEDPYRLRADALYVKGYQLSFDFYNLTKTIAAPHMDIYYHGDVSIAIDILQQTQCLILHSSNLEFKDTALYVSDAKEKHVPRSFISELLVPFVDPLHRVEFDEEKEFALLVFTESIPPGQVCCCFFKMD